MTLAEMEFNEPSISIKTWEFRSIKTWNECTRQVYLHLFAWNFLSYVPTHAVTVKTNTFQYSIEDVVCMFQSPEIFVYNYRVPKRALETQLLF